MRVHARRAQRSLPSSPHIRTLQCHSLTACCCVRATTGMALVDTSRMGGGGTDLTLYVCDSGNGRVLALNPKELDEVRFEIGRPGDGDGELNEPVSVCASGDHLAIAERGNHRVSVFTLRGTFLRHVGERPSKFSSGARPGQFVRPPVHVAMAPGHLFVLEEKGTRMHVLHPESGEPLGLLYPPWNVIVPKDDKGLLDTSKSEGCLTGLCVDQDALYVGSLHGPPRILRLMRVLPPQKASMAAQIETKEAGG